MTLNAEQQAVVDSKAALRVVLASPGSGKTRTLVRAVLMAAAAPTYQEYAAKRIAVMTFTNAGANEFRQRLGPISLIHCGTLHSYCFRLIQRHGDLLGYIPGKVGILPDKERIPRLLACRDKLGYKMSERLLMERSDEQGAIRLVWREYEFLLKRNNLVDYDLILRDGLVLLQMPPVRHQVQLDYLFIDESQDSAAIDWSIYSAIPAMNKMIVGDGDQSIFAFRGAHSDGLRQMTQCPGAEVHKLELNYRSDIFIAAAANDLIEHNKKRVEKRIIPVSEEEGHISVTAFEDAGQELAFIASTIISENNRDGQTPSIAVLYRMNYGAKLCRDYLRSMGIPIQEQKYAERPADWERALLLLGLMQSPDNEVLAERYLSFDFEPSIVQEFKLQAAVSGRSLLNTALPHSQFNSFENWTHSLAVKGVSESTVRLIQERAELLAPDADLGDLIHALHEPEEPEKASDDATGVTVSTIHGAKGKEWDVCFIPDCEEGIIPSLRSDIEEERRLMFTAVTRARHELYISWSKWRKPQWGNVTEQSPSRFISEMGL